MKEYPKIQNVFKFDEKYRNVVGLNEPFETLKNIKWYGTEKVDGTNCQICWDGHNIQINGRTERSVMPENLDKYFKETFLTSEMEYVFEQIFEDKEVVIYGEGYGAKIQQGGGNYIPNAVSFIVFDILIDGIWLKRENVEDICKRLNLDIVPLVFKGTIDEAKEYIASHPNSILSDKHEMEGIVIRPMVELYDRKGNLITCKVKYRDMVKAGLAE